MGSHDDDVNWEEKRRFPRLRETCGIRVKPIAGAKAPADAFSASTINISGGGLCFRSDAAMERDDCMAVELTFDDRESPLIALARVAFCKPEGDGHEVGVEFLWVGWGQAAAQEVLAQRIESALEKGDA